MTFQPRSLVAALSLAAAATAQTLTITDGNTVFATGALSATSQLPRTLALRGDALGTNHGFEHWWYYRLAGDARESALRNLGGVTGGVAPFLTHLDRDFADVDARGVFAAYLDADVYATGPASGVAVSRLTLHNFSNAPQTIDLFAYADLDVAGSTVDTVTGTADRHFVGDVTGVQVEVRGAGSDRSEIGAWPSVRNKLTNALVDDLDNSLPPFSGDYTGAFQWQARTLQPGEWRTFQLVFAINTPANALARVEHYGAGCTNSPQIYTDTLPVQDHTAPRQIGIQLKGGVPGAVVALLSNTLSAPGVPFVGMPLWVDPLPPAQSPLGFLPPSGEANVVFPIPNSPYVTGFPIYHQYFWQDLSAPSGIGNCTAGLMTVVGRL